MENSGTKLEQRLKKKSSNDKINWGSIPCLHSKPWHYFWCHDIMADRSLADKSLAVFWEALPVSDSDRCRYSQLLDWDHRPYRRVKGRIEGEEGDCISTERTKVSTNPDPLEFPKTKPPTKQHTWAGSWQFSYVEEDYPNLISLGEDVPNLIET